MTITERQRSDADARSLKEKNKKKPQRSFLQLCHLVRHSNPKHGLERQFHLPLLSWLCTGWDRVCFPPRVACRATFVLGGFIHICRRDEAERQAAGSRAHPRTAPAAAVPLLADLHKPASPQLSEVSDRGITTSPLAHIS